MNSRAKGVSGERELARLLRDELGVGVVRNLAQAREGGADLLGIDGWAIEVKRAKTAAPATLRAWWAQAEVQAERAMARPALAWRTDRSEWRVAIRLYDLARLGPLPGFEHAGVRPLTERSTAAPPDPAPDLGGPDARWPGWRWTATLSLEGFCAVVREGLGPSGASTLSVAKVAVFR